MFADPVAEKAAALLPPWPSSVASQIFANIVALRTWQMDAAVEAAFETGLDQVVVLGAGLDTRFWRVHPPTATTIVELDSAAIHEFAGKLLPGGGPGQRLEARIPSGIVPALRRVGHDARRPTLWIAEGLLEYLPGQLWHRLTRTLTERSAPGSRALITVLGKTLPALFAHDPTFPFPQLPSLARILSAVPEGWTTTVIPAAKLREVGVDEFAVISLCRSESLPS